MSAPARPRRTVDGGDLREDWTAAPDTASAAALATVHRPWLLDPTPVSDLEAPQDRYDPRDAAELDRQLDQTFGGTP